MRHTFAQVLAASVLAAAGAFSLAACNASLLPVDVQSTPDSGKSDSGVTSSCTGSNPGCCNPICGGTNPEATCADGEWTCPSGDSVGPACPALCEVVDGGPVADASDGCTGSNPGCCSTDCAVTPPEATCKSGKWTCPAGDTVGPVCDDICIESDASAPVDASPGCTGSNPGCCSTNCAVTPPEATCDNGTWTCPSGDTLGPVCTGLCIEPDASAPVDASPGCPGTAPVCCGLDSSGCEAAVGVAKCSASGSWKCPAGDSVAASGVCPAFCVAQDAGIGPLDAGTCAGDAPACCFPSPLCETLSAVATCTGGGWVCPAGSTDSPSGACACAVSTDAGVCPGETPSCCFPPPLCETLVASASCSSSGWVCPAGSTDSPSGACACAGSSGSGS